MRKWLVELVATCCDCRGHSFSLLKGLLATCNDYITASSFHSRLLPPVCQPHMSFRLSCHICWLLQSRHCYSQCHLEQKWIAHHIFGRNGVVSKITHWFWPPHVQVVHCTWSYSTIAPFNDIDFCWYTHTRVDIWYCHTNDLILTHINQYFNPCQLAYLVYTHFLSHHLSVAAQKSGRLNAGVAAAIANVDVKPGAENGRALMGKPLENHRKNISGFSHGRISNRYPANIFF